VFLGAFVTDPKMARICGADFRSLGDFGSLHRRRPFSCFAVNAVHDNLVVSFPLFSAVKLIAQRAEIWSCWRNAL